MTPRGDYRFRPQKGTGRYVSYGRRQSYDDGGRGGSKQVWEWFEENYNAADEKKVWLMNQGDDTCYNLIRCSTNRFGIEDIAVTSVCDLDTRAKRLVEKKLTSNDWKEYWTHLVEGYERVRGEIQKRDEEDRSRNSERWEAEAQARRAERIVIYDNDVSTALRTVDLSAGSLKSEFTDAFKLHERVDDDEGDWLDDPVAGHMTGHGFGDEIKQRSSVKLQITLSLDCSNSMYYNTIHKAAANAFREIGLSMRALKSEFHDDLFIGFFLYSQDDWRDGRGKRVIRLIGKSESDTKDVFGELWNFRQSEIEGWYGQGGVFSGEDTFVAPLFEKIDEWERKESDSGAIKLDLIITDAVLEHKGDIVEASIIQDNRDGALQTVFLNLMPEGDWVMSSLPRHCTQYHVDVENLSGALRNLIMDFVQIQL